MVNRSLRDPCQPEPDVRGHEWSDSDHETKPSIVEVFAFAGARHAYHRICSTRQISKPVIELAVRPQRKIYLEEGFRSVKMRLGRPTLAEDMARVEAMRKHLPDDVEMMVDANEAWRVDEAMRAMAMLAPFDLVWLEEPIAPDNIAGQAHLRAIGSVPLAAGENLHTLAEFTTLITAGGVDFPEPDLTTCGGITPFMKIVRLAEAHGLPVISHGAHDLHVHLLAAAPNAAYLEWHGFGLDRYMADPLTVDSGFATAPERPGHGIDFDLDQLNAHRVDA